MLQSRPIELGLLLNFGRKLLRDGIERVVNGTSLKTHGKS